MSAKEAIKRLSLRKLPPVLCFQLKVLLVSFNDMPRVTFLQRFEHKSTDKSAARKIDTPIRFPAVLNMLEFTTVVAGMQESDEAHNGTHRTRCVWWSYRQLDAIHGCTSDPGPETMYEYDLFAVINHEGQMNNGHYTNFARYCDEVSALAVKKQIYQVCYSGTDLMMISMFNRQSHSLDAF